MSNQQDKEVVLSRAAREEFFLAIGTTAVAAFTLWDELRDPPEERSIPALGAAGAGLVTGLGFLYFAWRQARRDHSGIG